MSLDTTEGYGYERLLPEIPLPPIIEIDISILPDFWAHFCEQHRIRPLAVLAYENQLGQMKLWGAREILRQGIVNQQYGASDTATDSTSGNFGEAVAWFIEQILAQDPSFPIKKVKAVVTHSTPTDKVERLIRRGIEPIYAKDSLEAMKMAKTEAEKNGWWYLEQYWNPANSVGYERIARHLAHERPHLGVMSCGVGSGGSCSGIMPVLSKMLPLTDKRNNRQHLHRVAVVVEAGESVDGVRTEVALEPGTLPWRKCVDDVRFVGLQKSLECCAALWQQGTDCGPRCIGGPSTGFALEGGLLSLRSLAAMEKLGTLRAPDGYVEFAFLSPDKRDPYRKKFRDRSIYFEASA